MSRKFHYPDTWEHPHKNETPEERAERIRHLWSWRIPIQRKKTPSISVLQSTTVYRRQPQRHTTKRRGKGDFLTNHQRVLRERK